MVTSSRLAMSRGFEQHPHASRTGRAGDPIRNRGVAFSAAEREALGLTGRLPSGVLTLEQQARRVYQQLQAQGSDLAGIRRSPRVLGRGMN